MGQYRSQHGGTHAWVTVVMSTGGNGDAITGDDTRIAQIRYEMTQGYCTRGDPVQTHSHPHTHTHSLTQTVYEFFLNTV